MVAVEHMKCEAFVLCQRSEKASVRPGEAMLRREDIIMKGLWWKYLGRARV
jgi:hypothetical protein